MRNASGEPEIEQQARQPRHGRRARKHRERDLGEGVEFRLADLAFGFGHACSHGGLHELADRLAERFSSGEIAEIVRQTEVPQIRAIAYETLALLPVPAILPLLDDPLYQEIAANALEQKAFEYDSEEARDLLEQFDDDTRARSD